MSHTPDFRPGDWICCTPNCQNHNFARQTACRRCGQMRPTEGGMVGGMAGMPANFRAGDWICRSCTNHNFARNTTCRRCGAGNGPQMPQMPPVAPGMPGGPMGMSEQGRPLPPTFRAGDWMCNTCNAHNYASRTTCRECDAGKPLDAEQQFSPQQFAYGAGYAASAAYAAPYAAAATAAYAQAQYGLTAAYGYGAPQASFAQSGWKPGDWACPKPTCGFHNFARQTTCKQCASPRPEEGGASVIHDQ